MLKEIGSSQKVSATRNHWCYASRSSLQFCNMQHSNIFSSIFCYHWCCAPGSSLAFLTSLMLLVPSKITPTVEYFTIINATLQHCLFKFPTFYQHCCFTPTPSLQHSNILPSLMPRPKISSSIFTHCAIIDATLTLRSSCQFANIFDATL